MSSGRSPVESAAPRKVPPGSALRNCGFVPKPCFCGLSARPSASPLKTLRVFRRLSGPKQSRAWHPREFGAVLGGSTSLPLPAPPLPSSSRRYAPQCFVAGIPSPRLATCLTAHPTNRVVACRSVRHSPPRPLPHLPIGAFSFAASALADVPSASLTLSAYPPERSGVAEGELNAGCKSAAWSRQDLITTDIMRGLNT